MKYDRERSLPLSYEDLKHFESSIPLIDKENKDTLWETVFYAASEMDFIYRGLKEIYAILKADGDLNVIRHLTIDRIDLCVYGNTKPFRVRVVNTLNDNFDYFYVKIADASRIYGLELEHILSPDNLAFIVNQDTLIEEHIVGIPGDVFCAHYLNAPEINKSRIAKEFVKFNERCFIRLLGDMHANNFVVAITPDFDDVHYRIRAIDFDQQSYDGRKFIYQPQYFAQNKALVDVGIEVLTPETVEQYQKEERYRMASRLRSNRYRIKDLGDAVVRDRISTDEHTLLLQQELAKHYRDRDFMRCKNMGQVVKTSLRIVLKQTRHAKPIRGF
jgi:hypothetical protein